MDTSKYYFMLEYFENFSLTAFDLWLLMISIRSGLNKGWFITCLISSTFFFMKCSKKDFISDVGMSYHVSSLPLTSFILAVIKSINFKCLPGDSFNLPSLFKIYRTTISLYSAIQPAYYVLNSRDFKSIFFTCPH